jgi:hypothetical protein
MGGDISVTEQFFATLRRSEHLEPEKQLDFRDGVTQLGAILPSTIAKITFFFGGHTCD